MCYIYIQWSLSQHFPLVFIVLWKQHFAVCHEKTPNQWSTLSSNWMILQQILVTKRYPCMGFDSPMYRSCFGQSCLWTSPRRGEHSRVRGTCAAHPVKANTWLGPPYYLWSDGNISRRPLFTPASLTTAPQGPTVAGQSSCRPHLPEALLPMSSSSSEQVPNVSYRRQGYQFSQEQRRRMSNNYLSQEPPSWQKNPGSFDAQLGVIVH